MAWRQSGEMPAELRERPDDPEILMYLWTWYWEIRAGERRDEWSGVVHPLSYVDLDAWQRVTGISLTHAEVDLLMEWDRRRRTMMIEERERGHGNTQAGSRQQRGQDRRPGPR